LTCDKRLIFRGVEETILRCFERLEMERVSPLQMESAKKRSLHMLARATGNVIYYYRHLLIILS